MWELVLGWGDGRRRWRRRAIAMIAAKADGAQKRISRERSMMARRSERSRRPATIGHANALI
jgi:hypothetical protein